MRQISAMTALLLVMAACSPDYVLDETPDTETAPLDTGEDIIIDEEPIAQAPVYANTKGELFEVTPETGISKSIGFFHDAWGDPVEGMVDIAIDLTGRMYGGTFDALYRIDPTTAQVVKVCDTDIQMFALTFADDGTLFAGAGRSITRIDVDAATCTGVALFSDSPYETSGDLVGLPDGNLYWTVRGEGGDELVKVNPISGGSSWIGPIVRDKLFGLGYDNGTLYGFSDHGEIVSIPPDGGPTKLTHQDPNTEWWGATTNPVKWD